jgi:hypothetical protein
MPASFSLDVYEIHTGCAAFNVLILYKPTAGDTVLPNPLAGLLGNKVREPL